MRGDTQMKAIYRFSDRFEVETMFEISLDQIDHSEFTDMLEDNPSLERVDVWLDTDIGLPSLVFAQPFTKVYQESDSLPQVIRILG
jgi:hypothetical protein